VATYANDKKQETNVRRANRQFLFKACFIIAVALENRCFVNGGLRLLLSVQMAPGRLAEFASKFPTFLDDLRGFVGANVIQQLQQTLC